MLCIGGVWLLTDIYPPQVLVPACCLAAARLRLLSTMAARPSTVRGPYSSRRASNQVIFRDHLKSRFKHLSGLLRPN
jgi:hypothetical protein